jgi:hypothetical protein
MSIFSTKQRDRVVKTPASYSGGPKFKSRRGERLPTEVLRGFLQTLHAISLIEP